jgi:hypothetical protein
MGVVVNDEQAVAEAMWGANVDWSQRIEERLKRGREGFAHAVVLRGADVALCSKHESQEHFFT